MPRRLSPRPSPALATLLAGALLLACSPGPSVGLPPADPARQTAEGLPWLSRAAIDAYLAWNARIGNNSGYVALFAHQGKVVHAKTTGFADIERRRPMALDTRFRMASLMKPVTAAATLILVDEGRLGLDDPVSALLPAAEGLRVAASHERGDDGSIPTEPLARPLTVRHLLTFESGIGSDEDPPSDLAQLWVERDIRVGPGSLADRADRALALPLFEQPGERWRYGWASDVLARVVEVAAGEPFGEFVERRIFVPLGMASSGFLQQQHDNAALATIYTQDPARKLVPVLAPRGDVLTWTPGGSGLVSTASDYMRFALMLWNGGSYAGVRILSPESVARMTRPHVTRGVLADQEVDLDGVGWGLGVAVVMDADATPMMDRDGDYWWSGLFGTIFFVSPEAELVSVVLTQNEPSPHSPLPYPLYVAPALAAFGL